MVLPSIGQNKCYGNTIFIVTSVFALKMAAHSEIHRHPEEEDVPTAFILTNRWQYHAESLPRYRDHKLFIVKDVCTIPFKLEPLDYFV